MDKQTDGFDFEVEGPRRCLGGPYMWGDKDSPMYKYCSKFSMAEVEAATCDPGLYNGAPIHHFDYTSASNSNWEGEQCKKCDKNTDHGHPSWSCGYGPHPF